MTQPESTKNPQQILDYTVTIRNFAGEFTP